MIPKQLLREMTILAKTIGDDLIFYGAKKYEQVLEAPVPHLGENIFVQAHAYALMVVFTAMCVGMSGKDEKEVHNDVQATLSKCIQELMAKYSKTGTAILVDVKEFFKKEGEEQKPS